VEGLHKTKAQDFEAATASHSEALAATSGAVTATAQVELTVTSRAFAADIAMVEGLHRKSLEIFEGMAQAISVLSAHGSNAKQEEVKAAASHDDGAAAQRHGGRQKSKRQKNMLMTSGIPRRGI